MNQVIPRQGPEAEARWRKHLEDQQRSGLTKSAYCREHRLKEHALTYWTTKFNKAAKARVRGAPFTKVTSTFHESSKLDPSPPNSLMQSSMRLTFPGGVTLDLAGHFDPNAIARLIAAVGGVK